MEDILSDTQHTVLPIRLIIECVAVSTYASACIYSHTHIQTHTRAKPVIGNSSIPVSSLSSINISVFVFDFSMRKKEKERERERGGEGGRRKRKRELTFAHFTTSHILCTTELLDYCLVYKHPTFSSLIQNGVTVIYDHRDTNVTIYFFRLCTRICVDLKYMIVFRVERV